MWNLVYACDKYYLDIAGLESWFATWYWKQDIEQYYHNWATHKKDANVLSVRPTLFPCWRFNHTKVFHKAIGVMQYNESHTLQ